MKNNFLKKDIKIYNQPILNIGQFPTYLWYIFWNFKA